MSGPCGKSSSDWEARPNGIPREGGFDIAVASELMAVLCLASDLEDMKAHQPDYRRLYRDSRPVTVADLKVAGALTVLFKEAIKPNLVQTLEGTPTFIHGGPFANIAHGCNSVIASKFALKLGDILVTEAGFGADLGAEKFMNIKCRMAGLKPDVVVLVATLRALKYQGVSRKAHSKPAIRPRWRCGMGNLEKHIENIRKFGLQSIVAINAFPGDTAEELALVERRCRLWAPPWRFRMSGPRAARVGWHWRNGSWRAIER